MPNKAPVSGPLSEAEAEQILADNEMAGSLAKEAVGLLYPLLKDFEDPTAEFEKLIKEAFRNKKEAIAAEQLADAVANYVRPGKGDQAKGAGKGTGAGPRRE